MHWKLPSSHHTTFPCCFYYFFGYSFLTSFPCSSFSNRNNKYESSQGFCPLCSSSNFCIFWEPFFSQTFNYCEMLMTHTFLSVSSEIQAFISNCFPVFLSALQCFKHKTSQPELILFPTPPFLLLGCLDDIIIHYPFIPFTNARDLGSLVLPTLFHVQLVTKPCLFNLRHINPVPSPFSIASPANAGI